ncbi:uberolysin/carnocyclin family circular bacteriocin [Anaerocellum danielii]|uniref:Uberolysin/carnocyclin family circular bacteriocin n=1 Tax=Anaerocellum danielii TaxID=1387557 RepID=A0ABZ0TZ23_9FIRM|nr:uberolysin/carnocyclin family circular bacteriocin [Caldicellulosiruptor danielii]WPX08721.1 uberolysin/carnocyclin family circular bacteriocin [Caldicellulosiruptor danielii]
MLLVAATLGIPETIATTVVNIILTGSTIVSIIIALTSILTAGISAILAEGGWVAFVNLVKSKVAQLGLRGAILW